MGRRKIVIERIKDPNKRYVAFTKRRQGLFKKADTACRMYGSQIGIIVFSPTGKLYSSGPVDSVINQFLHQSSSSSSSYLNLKEENLVIASSSTTTTGDHIEDGKKRSRSGDDDDDRVPMMPEERETKKMKLLMSSTTTTTTTEAEAAAAAAAAAATEEEEEFLLIKNSEETDSTEEEGLLMMKNEFMGFEQNVDYNMGSSSSTTTTAMTTTTSLVASSCFLESDQDHDELDEVLNGFADYIIADHHPYEETMFDMLPHQGVYDDDQARLLYIL